MTPNQWANEAFTTRRHHLPADLAPEQVADLLTDPDDDPAWDRLPTTARLDAWRCLHRLALRASGAPVDTRRRRRRWRKWMDPDLKPAKKTARRLFT